MSQGPLEFGGSEDFPAAPERVFDLLTDLDGVVGLVPDLVSSQRTGPQSVECVVRPGFSFLRGTLKLKIEVSNIERPRHATMLVAAQGIGVTIRIESQLNIEPQQVIEPQLKIEPQQVIEPVGSGSRLTWTARIVEMKGLVASLSPALVRAAADQVIRHAWQKVRERHAQ